MTHVCEGRCGEGVEGGRGPGPLGEEAVRGGLEEAQERAGVVRSVCEAEEVRMRPPAVRESPVETGPR